MILYSMLFSIILSITFLELTNIKRIYIVWMLVIFSMILIFLSGIRWETGTDWNMYIEFFKKNNTLNDYIIASSEVQGIELGYGIINLIIKSFFDEYNIFLILVGGFIISVKLKWILKYSLFPACAVFINFSTYLGDIFFIRQIIALCITLIAFNFIVKKEKYKFLFFVLLSATIHISALAFIPAYWIYHSNIQKKYIISLLIIAILLDITKINVNILNLFLEYFPSDTGKIFQKIHEYYLLGQSGENFGQAVDGSFRILLALLRRLFFLPIYIYCLNKLSKINIYYKGCFNLVIFGNILFFIMSMISIDFSGRLSMYYYIYEIILISSLLAWKDNIKYKISMFFIILIYCIMKYVYLIYSLHEYYLPYNTFF